MPATAGLPVAWLPDWDIAAMTIVRPVPWARSLGDLAFRPERWGNRLIRIAAPGGTHLLIRRHAAPELALWVPAGLEPKPGGPFRSEEHTSELQSLMRISYAVFCLKKKKK